MEAQIEVSHCIWGMSIVNNFHFCLPLSFLVSSLFILWYYIHICMYTVSYISLSALWFHRNIIFPSTLISPHILYILIPSTTRWVRYIRIYWMRNYAKHWNGGKFVSFNEINCWNWLIFKDNSFSRRYVRSMIKD